MHEAKNSNDGHTPENAQKMRLSAELLENIPSGVALYIMKTAPSILIMPTMHTSASTEFRRKAKRR